MADPHVAPPLSDEPSQPQRYDDDGTSLHHGFNDISLGGPTDAQEEEATDFSQAEVGSYSHDTDSPQPGDPTPRLGPADDMGILSEPVRYRADDDDDDDDDTYEAQRGMPSRLEAERAGLEFVDITLDTGAAGGALGGGVDGGDLGAPGSPYLSSPGRRSAQDIIKDSISSGSKAAKQMAKEERKRLKQLQKEQGDQGQRQGGRSESRASSSTSRTDPTTTTSGSRRGSEAPSLGSTTPGSNAASPRPLPPQALVTEDEAVGITVGGEDGEVQVVRLESPKTLILKRLPESAPIAIPKVQEQRGKVEEQDGLATQDTAGRDAEQVKDRVDGNDDAMSATSTSVQDTASAAANASTSPNDGHAAQLHDVDVGDGGLRDVADSPSKDKKSKPSSGPSAFERYMSRTRMMTLPPKPRQEDDKHLSDFATMMRRFQEKEKKRAEEEEERKRKRDEELEEDMKVWEKEILPSWTRARREGRLKEVWKKGAPPNLRGKVWALACGNAQMLPRNLFQRAIKQAKEEEIAGKLSREDLGEMESDIEETLPSLKLFQRDVGPLYEDLRDVLLAFIMVRVEQVRSSGGGGIGGGFSGSGSATASTTTTTGLGISTSSSTEDSTSAPTTNGKELRVYQKGVAALSAMLISNMSPSESLIALLNLIAERPWLKALYSLPTSSSPSSSSSSPRGQPTSVDPAVAYERVFDTLLADQLPKCYANLQARGVQAKAYVRHWARTLFVPYLPFDTAARLWDWILLEENDSIMFRSGLAIVRLLSSRLYVPDKAELLSILQGNNRASLHVWYRSQMAGGGSPVLPSRISSSNGVPTKSPPIGGAEGSGMPTPTPSSPQVPTSATSATSLGAVSSTSVVSTSSSSLLVPPASAGPHEADPSYVPLDDIYAQYGISQDTLFGTLEEQEEWWKDSTLERLLDRELG